MSLRENVHELTREHWTTGPDGKPGTVPALLDQIEEAIKPNTAGGASGTSARTRLPINATALACWQDINRDARDHQAELIPSYRGTLKAIIQSWTVESINGEWETFLGHVTLEWCDRIKDILSPTKPWHPSYPCPACGRRFHGDENAPTLSLHWLDPATGDVMHPEDWTMECEACEASWEGKTLGAIAWSMATDVKTGANA